MAEEMQLSAQGPNGDRLNLRVGNKTLGGSALAVIAVLIIAGAFGGGLLVAKILFLGQAKGQEQLTRLTELLAANNQKVTTGQQDLLAHLLAALRAQDERVNQQTTAIDARIEKLETYTEGWFTEVGTRLELLNWNIAHPDQALPLRGTQPPPQPAPGGQR